MANAAVCPASSDADRESVPAPPAGGGRGAGLRRRVAILGLFTVLACALGVGGALFVRHAERRIATLPMLVRAGLRREGEPLVGLGAIAPALPAASVAVEDRSFWTNPGISFEGVARAAVVDFANAAWVEGGSTITQQLVRDELLGFQKTLHRKIIEMAYAVLVTIRFSKPEILTLYLNEVDYGNGAFGVAAAAHTYFDTTPAHLTLAECVLLAGLPQYPAGLDPFTHPRAALERRAVVVAAMVHTHAISAAEGRRLDAQPLDLHAPHGAAGS